MHPAFHPATASLREIIFLVKKIFILSPRYK